MSNFRPFCLGTILTSFWDPFGSHFGSPFGAILVSFWCSDGVSGVTAPRHRFFDVCLTPPKSLEPSKTLFFTMVFKGFCYIDGCRFRRQRGPKMGQQWVPKWSKIVPRGVPKMVPDSVSVFGSFLEPFWVPKWYQNGCARGAFFEFGAFWLPRLVQKVSKKPPRGPKRPVWSFLGCQNGPFWVPFWAPKRPQHAFVELFWVPSWCQHCFIFGARLGAKMVPTSCLRRALFEFGPL